MKTAPTTQYVRLFSYLFSLLFMANSANAEQIKNKVLEYKKLEWQLPNELTLGNDYQKVYQTLISQCQTLVEKKKQNWADSIQPNKHQLSCQQYPYLNKSRHLLASFEKNTLTAIDIMGMRDHLAELINRFNLRYQQPTKQTMRFAYYKKSGTCLDFALATLSFVKPQLTVNNSQVSDSVCLNDQGYKKHPKLTQQQWLADLAKLDQYIRQQHVNPFWLNSEQSYLAIFQQAQAYINRTVNFDEISALKINSYFEQMIAHLADGHAYMADKTKRFGALPIYFQWFADALVISAITKNNQSLLAGQVTHVGNRTLAEALVLLKPYLPSVNKSAFKSRSQYGFRFVGLLYAAGIIENAEQVSFTVINRAGKSIKKTIKLTASSDRQEMLYLNDMIKKDNALTCQKSTKNQCLQYLTEFNALYFRYAAVIEENKGDIKSISAELIKQLNTTKAERLIIDVRDNSGGNSYHNAQLVNAISQHQSINQKGKLFVLTHYQTFSAAINFVGAMHTQTAATFIGEPVGDAAYFPGEGGPQAVYVLPHSHYLLSLSFSQWLATFEHDKALVIPVDRLVYNRISDVLNGEDKVLNTALTYQQTQKKSKQQIMNKQRMQAWLGRYNYSLDKSLTISVEHNLHGSQLMMTVAGQLSSPLVIVDNNTLRSELYNIEIKRNSSGIVWQQEGQVVKTFKRLANDELKALDYLLRGDVNNAKSAYLTLVAKYPEQLSLSGNNLGLLASALKAQYPNQQYYQQLRHIVVSMHGFPIASWDQQERQF